MCFAPKQPEAPVNPAPGTLKTQYRYGDVDVFAPTPSGKARQVYGDRNITNNDPSSTNNNGQS